MGCLRGKGWADQIARYRKFEHAQKKVKGWGSNSRWRKQLKERYFSVPKAHRQRCCIADASSRSPPSRFVCTVSSASSERPPALSPRHGGDDEGGDTRAAGAASSRHDDGDSGAAEGERPRPGEGKENGEKGQRYCVECSMCWLGMRQYA